jgi:hypothetical protein
MMTAYLQCSFPFHTLFYNKSSGNRLTVLVTVSVLVTRTLVRVTVVVLVVLAAPLVMRHEQAEEMAGRPPGKPSETLIWRALRTGSSSGQAAS